MAEAEVGDDVYGEDPTVNALERRAAEMTGHQAALFVASGHMANLCGLLAQTERGDEFIVGATAHMFLNEVAAAAVVGGLQARTIADGEGQLDPVHVEAAIRGQNIHWPRSRVLCVENTHNMAGGVAMSLDRQAALLDVARSHGLRTHLDGARVFNAAACLEVPVERLTSEFDSVYICLSKGLGAPVGSLLCGAQDLIDSARRYRKMLGGGWRQAGVLAAAGLLALDVMPAKLAGDHRRARRLAEALTALPGLTIDLSRVQTNIIFADCAGVSAFELCSRLAERGVLASPTGDHRLRLVTHHQVSDQDIDQAISAFGEALQRRPSVSGG